MSEPYLDSAFPVCDSCGRAYGPDDEKWATSICKDCKQPGKLFGGKRAEAAEARVAEIGYERANLCAEVARLEARVKELEFHTNGLAAAIREWEERYRVHVKETQATIAELRALCREAGEKLDSTETSYRLCTSSRYSKAVEDLVQRLRAAGGDDELGR